MSKGDKDLGKFFRDQEKIKADRDARRRNEEIAKDVKRMAELVAELQTILALVPDEIKEYAAASVDVRPPRVVVSAPGCYPVYIVPLGGGIRQATVASPTPQRFPLDERDDFAEIITAAIVDQAQQTEGPRGVTP